MQIAIGGHCAPTCHAALSMQPGQLDTIIITDPNWPLPHFVPDMAKDYLHMQFVDTCDVMHPHCPKTEHVQQMLEWAEGRERLLICCHAGVSRSSATALLIATKEGGLNEAFRVLTPGWHHPNRLILKIGDILLNKPVYEAYKAWRKKVGYD